MDFICPKCLSDCDIEGDDLSDYACDDTEWECPECGKITIIGWYATVEER